METAVGETRVTLLEDHRILRESISRMLQQAGIQVVAEYGDPQPFLSRLASDHPDVALVDIVLPGGEAVWVLEQAHQFHPDTRLLVLSGCAEPQMPGRCMQAGAAGYLDKTTTTSEVLLNAIRAVRRGESVLPAEYLETFFEQHDQDPHGGLLKALSAREREVLGYVTAGADNLKIASCLNITERTVKAHVSSLYRKLGQENRTQLALLARELGIRPAADV
jgi:two-component system, NarL family, nitrate/nitrite response regulator NarL